MISVPGFDVVQSIGCFLREANYDVSHLRKDLELGDSLHANLDNLEPLLHKTEGDSKLAILARLFFVGWPVDIEVCRRVLSETFVHLAMAAGLVRVSGAELEPGAAIMPFEDLLIACDVPRSRGANPDMVLGPSPSTFLISKLAVPGLKESTLDLGTGGGVLAIKAAAYSQCVIGTDINSRAIEFAKFSAALNGVSNVRFACGDAFVPVNGRRFTRIIANPPFFVSPAKKFTYCDNPLELDGFSRRLVKEASGHLEEGGYSR